MRLICLLLVYANICCAKTFFFGGSVDVALEWPLQPSFDPKIEVFCDSNDHISTVNTENSIITCLNSNEEETTLHLRIKYSDEQDQEGNTYHSVLQKLQATQFLLVESQKEEVDQFIIPPPPYSSLESTIPLTSEDSITLSLEPGFHKVSLHAFHCSAIGQLHKQCTPLTNFPRQIFFVNTFGERTKLFQKSLQTKLAEKMGETRQISSGYKTMSNLYKNYRLHSDIFSFDKKFIDNQLLDFISGNAKLSDVVHPVTQTGIYMLHVFTPEFCQKLIEEVDNYENFLVSNNIDPNEHRPNFLNKFGHLLDEMGLQSFLDDVMDQALSKITSLLFYEWGGDSLDSHHGFVVEYQRGAKDIDLEYHMDQAEVTLNLCLGKEFEGGSVFFNGIREHWSTEQLHSESFEFHHIPGAALLHIGQHWHGANKIQSGERYNLILWMRSSKYHQSLAEQYWEQEENSSGKINFQNIDVI